TTFSNHGTGIVTNSPAALSLTNNTFTGQSGFPVQLSLSGTAASTGNWPSLTLSGNSASGNGTNGISLSGSLSGTSATGTLPATPGIPYVVGGLSVGPGATLTLQAGTVLKMPSQAVIDVSGALQAQGTTSSPVIITSL